MVDFFHDLFRVIDVVRDDVFQVGIGVKIDFFKDKSDSFVSDPADFACEIDGNLGFATGQSHCNIYRFVHLHLFGCFDEHAIHAEIFRAGSKQAIRCLDGSLYSELNPGKSSGGHE